MLCGFLRSIVTPAPSALTHSHAPTFTRPRSHHPLFFDISLYCPQSEIDESTCELNAGSQTSLMASAFLGIIAQIIVLAQEFMPMVLGWASAVLAGAVAAARWASRAGA